MFAALMPGVFMLASCGGIFPERLRYRMTVEVDTPVGVRTGSTVGEWISYGNTPFLPGGENDVVEHEGEALAVDLPGGTLFVSVSSSWTWGQALRYGTVSPAIDVSAAADWPRSMGALMRSFRNASAVASVTPTQLPSAGEHLPVMLRFRNIADPFSVERVDPTALSASFGPGTRLRKISFAATDAPVSQGIQRRLPWLVQPERYRSNPDNPFTNRLPEIIDILQSDLRR